MNKLAAVLALGAGLLIASASFAEDKAIANAPVESAADKADPAANQRQAQSYETMLRDNGGYRNARIQKECGDIQDAALKQQCVASFPADATPPKKTK
jgi:hypothetical protein